MVDHSLWYNFAYKWIKRILDCQQCLMVLSLRTKLHFCTIVVDNSCECNTVRHCEEMHPVTHAVWTTGRARRVTQCNCVTHGPDRNLMCPPWRTCWTRTITRWGRSSASSSAILAWYQSTTYRWQKSGKLLWNACRESARVALSLFSIFGGYMTLYKYNLIFQVLNLI